MAVALGGGYDVPHVWAMTTYRRTADKSIGRRVIRDRRTVGLYPTAAEAIAHVLHNCGDLEEAGWYQYAVVEPIALGLYPMNDPAERSWFEFSLTEELWVPLSSIPQVILDDLGLTRDMLTNWSTIG
jgi:hypothetical protein